MTLRTLTLCLLAGSLLPAAPTASAQFAGPLAPPTVAFTYTSLRTNDSPGQCGCFFMNGAAAELTLPVSPYLALTSDFAGSTTSSVNGSRNGLSLFTYTLGPRLALPSGSFEPFAHALVGGSHGFGSYFPTTQGASRTNAIAFLAGGGLNLRPTPRLTLRLFQADYLLTHLPNGSTNRQNSLRLGAGIVFTLPPRQVR